MFSKKLVLNLGLVLFGLIYCTNAEQYPLDSNLRVAQDECVQVMDNKQSHDLDIDSVLFCKIHHGDSPELESLNLVDILREVWKGDGLDCDKILNGADKIKGCECTVTIKSCGCRVLDLCEEHCMRLDDLIESKLRAIRGNESSDGDDSVVEIISEGIQTGKGNDVNDCKCPDLAEDCGCTEAKPGRMYFDSGIIGIGDVNFDEDMSNLEPYGVYTRDFDRTKKLNTYWIGDVLYIDLSDVDLSNSEPDRWMDFGRDADFSDINLDDIEPVDLYVRS